MRARALTGLLAAVSAALLLAGCGEDEAATSTSTSPPGVDQHQGGEHNQADIEFAQGMILHHAQAIEMARQAQTQAQSPEIRDLAGRIEQAQGPEIVTLTAWLQAWNAEVPTISQHAGGREASGSVPRAQMPGMVDHQQMRQLGQAAGAEFDRLFLQMMIRHHDGAVARAQAELANGQNPEAKQLAQQIIAAQQAEIQEMQSLLPQG